MILTTNIYGSYEQPKEGLVQYWSEKNQRIKSDHAWVRLMATGK